MYLETNEKNAENCLKEKKNAYISIPTKLDPEKKKKKKKKKLYLIQRVGNILLGIISPLQLHMHVRAYVILQMTPLMGFF